MQRHKLGFKKHKKCEEITGKHYDLCYMRDNEEPDIVDCIYIQDGYRIDIVNIKTKKLLATT